MIRQNPKNMNSGGVNLKAQTEAGGKDYTELVFRLKVGGKRYWYSS